MCGGSGSLLTFLGSGEVGGGRWGGEWQKHGNQALTAPIFWHDYICNIVLLSFAIPEHICGIRQSRYLVFTLEDPYAMWEK